MNPLKHVAIIMDGNGRWGLKHKNSRNAGHKAGLNTVEKIIKESIKNKIDFLTLYAFSTENWKRPKKEINYLFSLLQTFLIERIEELHKQNIKLKIIAENENGEISVKEIELEFKKENENTGKLIDPETNFEPLNAQLAKEKVNFDDYGDKIIQSL